MSNNVEKDKKEGDLMTEKYTAYMHKNKINQKVYIGITTQKVEERWKNGKRI